MNNKTYGMIIKILLVAVLLSACQSDTPSHTVNICRQRNFPFFSACRPATPSPPLVSPRQVTASTLNLMERWRISTLLEDYSAEFPPSLVIIGDKVITGFNTEKSWMDGPESWLEAISLASGQVLWKSLYQGNISQSFHDDQRIYLISANYLGAYRLSDGKLLWEQNLTEHQAYWFLPWDAVDTLHIYSSANELIQIDPETGDILSKEGISSYMEYDGYQFVYDVNHRTINAVDLDANRIIWDRQIASRSRWQPAIVNDNLIFFDGLVRSPISCVHIPTGEDCWKTPDEYVSNHAIVNGLLYALGKDGVLKALDVETGQEAGQISFTAPIPQYPGGYSYWVAANEEYVLVYFGDSQELIAFGVTGQAP